MRLLKQAMAVLGTVLTIAVLVAIIAPKTAHAVAAALVQIVPGTTTHVGQNESQLVSLVCEHSTNYCNAIDADGTQAASPYVVPPGYTLIVTDWEFAGSTAAGNSFFDALSATSAGVFLITASTHADSVGNLYFHEKYATGIRVGSGVTILDYAAYKSGGTGYIQGYLVPNT